MEQLCQGDSTGNQQLLLNAAIISNAISIFPIISSQSHNYVQFTFKKLLGNNRSIKKQVKNKIQQN